MPVYQGSAKEYAAENGHGQKGRGRPSADALAFIAKAREQGWTFTKDSVAPSTPRVSAAPAPDKVDVSKVDPKAAREWATKNGVDVGDRGRVSYGILVQYQDAMAEAGTVVKDRKVPVGTNVNVKDIRPEAPRTIRAGTKWQGVVNGKTVTITNDRIACQVGRYSISHCGCPGGNHIVSLGGADSVPISPMV